MESSAGRRGLRLLGILCAAAGGLAWGALVWKAVASLERVTSQSEEGSRLMVWAVTGTVLMVGGMVLLHVAADAEESADRSSP